MDLTLLSDLLLQWGPPVLTLGKFGYETITGSSPGKRLEKFDERLAAIIEEQRRVTKLIEKLTDSIHVYHHQEVFDTSLTDQPIITNREEIIQIFQPFQDFFQSDFVISDPIRTPESKVDPVVKTVKGLKIRSQSSFHYRSSW